MEIDYQNSCQSPFLDVYLVLEVFQEREFKEMLAIFFLVLQACISFLRCFRQKWLTLVLPCSHKNAVAHTLYGSQPPHSTLCHARSSCSHCCPRTYLEMTAVR